MKGTDSNDKGKGKKVQLKSKSKSETKICSCVNISTVPFYQDLLGKRF